MKSDIFINWARPPTVKIYSEFSVEDFGGGVRLIVELQKYLSGKGMKVTIVDNENINSQKRISRKEIIEMTNNSLESGAFCIYGSPKLLFQYLPKLETLENDRSQVSLIFLRRVPPRVYLKELARSKINVVFCLHGIALEKLRLTNPLIIVHQVLLRLGLRYFSRFLRENIYAQTLTPHISENLVRNGGDPNNVVCIENGIGDSNFSVYEQNEIFQVLFIGRMENLQKGVSRLKRVANLLEKGHPRLVLKIIGTGKDSSLLQDLPRNAELLGNVRDNEKIELLCNSSVLLVTSNLDPYPLVSIEGLMAGLPVVTTPTEGVSYVISKNALFGTVSSFSPNDIVRDLSEYYYSWEENAEGYFELRKEISSKAKALFSEDKMLSSYFELIDKISQRSAKS